MGIVGLLTADPAHASEQALFYETHQAIGILEQMSRGTCSGIPHAHRFLLRADRALADYLMGPQHPKSSQPRSELEPELQQTWKLWRHVDAGKPLDAATVTWLRIALHDKAEKMGLVHHQKKWRDETRDCGSHVKWKDKKGPTSDPETAAAAGGESR